MLKTRNWLSLVAALVLSACGGAQFGDGAGGLGGTAGGTTPGVPAVLAVSASLGASGDVDPTLTVIADGTSTVLITALLTDVSGTPIRNRTIVFSTDAGTLVSEEARTNANGLAQVFLRAPTARGTATVIARETVTDLAGSVQVEFVAGLVQRLISTLSPVKLAPRAVASFTVTALDANDNPVSGQTISFETVPNGVGGIFNPTTVATDDNGRAVTAFEVGPNVGTFTLRARTASGIATSADLIVATQAALLLSVTPSQPSILADGIATAVISAVLTDSNGVPLSNRPIDFTTNAGTLLQNTATTDSNGLAEVTLRSSTIRGIATVVARDASTNVTGSTAVQFVNGQASRITTTLTPTTVAVGGSATFTATVQDANGNPVSGEIVSFDTLSGNGQFAKSTATTDGNGRASATFIASAAGTVTLRARTAGGLSSTAQLTVLQPDALLTLSATPASSVANGSTVIEIAAQLRDFNDNPLPNRTINFTTNLGTLLSGSALTNDSGVARVNLRAPTQSGTARVNAELSGGNASSSVAIEFTAGPPNQISLGVSPSTVAPGGAVAATAIVRDASGNPVAGGDVSFNVSPASCGSFNPTSVGTGPSGTAGSTFTAGANTGTCTLSASTAGGLNATAQLTIAVGVTGITVLASAPTLQSSAVATGEGLTITAQVRKEGNLVVPGATVNFSATSGLLQPVNNGVTDASGTARAILTTGGDPTNRPITITAANESSTGTVTISVVGTEISLDGPRSIQSGVQNTFVATLTNAVGAAIPNRTVTISTTGGTVTPASATTDANGKATFRLTVPAGPSVTLTASALGATDSIDISVTDDSLVFVSETDVPTVPACNDPRAISALGEIPLNTNRTIRVLWCRAGVPVAGQPVTFTTTRGAFGGSSSTTVNTAANGLASVVIQAQQAGTATVLAVGNDVSTDPVSTPFAVINGEFVATEPASVEVQADPSVIGINQESVIQATVRDAANNLVKNATVNFSLNDVTGGTLSAGSAVTNSQGRASVIYRASSTTSGQDGVRVTVTVSGAPPSVNDTVFLTVGSQSLRIVLGTGNEIRESADTTRYELPYTAIVTDAAGNPTPGAELSMTGFAERYGKGYYIFNGTVWVPVYTAICQNEDVNENGVLDPGEDTNNNGILDPANPASVPLRPPLDQNGVASFDITYPQDRGNWIETYRLRARARVAGTEATETVRFTLPISAEDASNEDASPPGAVSPFGRVGRCDLTDAQVPLIEFDPSTRALTAVEGGAGATLRINASQVFSENITIPLVASAQGTTNPFTLPATATILAGSLFVDVVLGVPDNSIVFPTGDVFVQLADPVTGNAIIGPGSTAVVTIVDND